MLRKIWLERPAVRLWLAWLVALAVTHAAIVLSGYALRDPDSVLYEWIATTLGSAPMSQWMTPTWQPGRWKSGLFQEHTAVLFWPAALLTKLGIPRAALLTGLVFFGLQLAALFALTKQLSHRAAAWVAVFLLVLSPGGIQYLLRFNHEPLWGACTTGALFFYLQRDRGRLHQLGFIGLALLACAVKGVLGLLVFAPAGVLWLTRRDRLGALLGVVALGVVALVAYGYEWSYRELSGESFFASYVGAQLTYVAREDGSALRKLVNVPYYVANLIYFSLPGSLLTLLALIQRRGSRDARVFFVQAGGSWVGLVSLMSRHAARYAYPVQAWLLIPAASYASERWPSVRTLHERHLARLPYILMGVLVLVVVARVLLDPLLYRPINVLGGTTSH